MTPIIEPARGDDIPRLVDLLDDLFGVELDFTADSARQQRGLELLIAASDSDRVVVAVARDAGGNAIGMGTAQLVISTAEGAPSAWIEDIVVHRDFRRQGIGNRLLDYLLAWARERGAARAQLLTDRENEAAELFYNYAGWRTTQLGVRRRSIE